MVATDSIKHNGTAFLVQPPHKAIKQLGVRVAITSDFSKEKEYVIEEMKKRLSALHLNKVLSPIPISRHKARSGGFGTFFRGVWSSNPTRDIVGPCRAGPTAKWKDI